jgi:hypothetical protein
MLEIDLEFPDGKLSDDDPDLVAGLAKLWLLRESEDEIVELRPRQD